MKLMILFFNQFFYVRFNALISYVKEYGFEFAFDIPEVFSENILTIKNKKYFQIRFFKDGFTEYLIFNKMNSKSNEN